ncbi:MAG: M20/M25/M40 family metallo-hydrolase [Planctomycetota bacterium]
MSKSKNPPTGLLPDNQATDLLMQLMALSGQSGEEKPVAELITKRLKQAGAPAKAITHDRAHKLSAHGGEIGNLMLKLPGTTKAPRRLLSAHMDTVPVCAGARPMLKGKKIVSKDAHTGLGADNRAGCAVLLSTALSILKNKLPHPPLTFLWTVQEEIGLYGARHVGRSKLGKPELAFNWDGRRADQLIVGATGGYRMEIEIGGVASHAGNHPEHGVSAIAVASLAIADLVENGWHGLIKKGKQQGTSNVGIIRGGAATNVVTDHLYLKAEARSHNSKFRERIVREIEKAFRKAAKKVRNTDGTCGEVKFEGQLDYDSFKLSPKSPSVVAAGKAIEADSATPELAIANGGLDANWLNAHGLPSVTMGCGQNDIHTVDEWQDLPEFHRARRIALRLASDVDE